MLVMAGRAQAIPAPRVGVVDTVGAGDTLNGALAAGLAAGFDLTEASHRAVVAASLSVAHEGARAGMPTAAQLEGALAR
jgi:ribokinase